MATAVEDMVEEAMVEGHAVGAAEVCSLSCLDGLIRPRFALRLLNPNLPFNLGQTCYSCGGYGHMSRDCTQGQKCYNCMSNPLLEASFSSDGQQQVVSKDI